MEYSYNGTLNRKKKQQEEEIPDTHNNIDQLHRCNEKMKEARNEKSTNCDYILMKSTWISKAKL